MVLQPVHRELVVVTTLRATASTLHSFAAARNARRRPQTPDTAHSNPENEWLDVHTDEDPATPPPRPPWRTPTWALPDPGADPTIYVPDYEHYNDAPRGSLPPIGNLPDSWGPVTSTNLNNYRTIVVTLTTRLPIAMAGSPGARNGRWASPAVPMAPSGGIFSIAAGP